LSASDTHHLFGGKESNFDQLDPGIRVIYQTENEELDCRLNHAE